MNTEQHITELAKYAPAWVGDEPSDGTLIAGINQILKERPHLAAVLKWPAMDAEPQRREYSVQFPDGRILSKDSLQAAAKPAQQYWTANEESATLALEDLLNSVAERYGITNFAAKVVSRLVRVSYSEIVAVD